MDTFGRCACPLPVSFQKFEYKRMASSVIFRISSRPPNLDLRAGPSPSTEFLFYEETTYYEVQNLAILIVLAFLSIVNIVYSQCNIPMDQVNKTRQLLCLSSQFTQFEWLWCSLPLRGSRRVCRVVACSRLLQR